MMSETLQEFGEWVNGWGNVERYRRKGPQFRAGYEQAMRDVFDRLLPLVPEWQPEKAAAVSRVRAVSPRR